jgi:hypothetical protein
MGAAYYEATQQEAPDVVNETILQFLRELDA